jgi:hypothetical protein
MVATNKSSAQLARTRSDFIRAGAVAHYVTEIRHGIVRRRRREARFQSFQIAVNVAKQEYAQCSPELAIIKPTADS